MRKKSKKMIIKAEDIKVSTGHRQHFTGTGAWDTVSYTHLTLPTILLV